MDDKAEPVLIRAAGIIIYNVDVESNVVKYLLLRSSSKPFHWTPPKGRLDPGEDSIDAAHRETLEEAGLTKEAYILHDDFKDVLNYQANGRDKECVYFLAKIADFPNTKVTLSNEHTDFAWVGIEDIPRYCDKESLRTMFVKAHEFLSKHYK
ncbi:Bifunctional bis(5'-adenosyl)-triphosphatase/adenylylsulfatase [Theileria parva strain Muguga]|uniref:Bis(5'-nucleosyl)-tetraphosphatase [asymmetrical] n=1 Tax=Theileria parva TaxID=5875 RepID=Q4N2P3_THEPA|nr:bis(5'-nucleosyl)-tetraphosphatase (Asymmetrical) [Theileria parva strain Muguga]EAN31655.1 Bifunctional bis(5'-adenosyl)-triphosphatase/adenylylsulfatase [Theileria parva strain Muguga]|eukprot:XP_763938.1 bis(5'-nucleosyl)-tetraphosphatase (Asymmetrical) [Theileria parva strain Muguga]